ncbi:hypothetical protein RKD18_000671 [Streptomyces phaeoluteigriseus]
MRAAVGHRCTGEVWSTPSNRPDFLRPHHPGRLPEGHSPGVSRDTSLPSSASCHGRPERPLIIQVSERRPSGLRDRIT